MIKKIFLLMRWRLFWGCLWVSAGHYLGGIGTVFAQIERDKLLLNNLDIQLDVTEAIDSLYNFNFEAAHRRFFWLKQKYPKHPLPYFLHGLGEWWRLYPEIETMVEDEHAFLNNMDTAIYYGRVLHQSTVLEEQIEGAFFVATAYAYISYFYAERQQYIKSAYYGKKALNYLEYCQNQDHLSIEVLTGSALYNYYSVWIPEHLPSLRLLMRFFRPGDKEKGLNQLRRVAHNAFYARTEAQIFLMKILYYDGIDVNNAWRINRYLRSRYPRNSYLHRYAMRILHAKGRYMENKALSLDFLRRLEGTQQGYGITGARYASYYLGFIYQHLHDQKDSALYYYARMIDYSRALRRMGQGYTLEALFQSALLCEKKKKPRQAYAHYVAYLRHASRKHYLWGAAKKKRRALRKQI